MRRKILARMVWRAWHECICRHYVEAEVNSEAALQALFCGYLLREFAGRPWRLFVEPRLKTSDGARKVAPDILVCNARRVIGAIELKYVPRGSAKSGKDLDTLAEIADLAAAGQTLVSNVRYRGELVGRKEYRIADNALLVWAAVSAREGFLDRTHRAFAGGQLLLVQAITDSQDKPQLIAEPKIPGMALLT